MSDEDLTLRISGDASGAVRATQQTTSAFQQVEQQAKSVATAVAAMAASLNEQVAGTSKATLSADAFRTALQAAGNDLTKVKVGLDQTSATLPATTSKTLDLAAALTATKQAVAQLTDQQKESIRNGQQLGLTINELSKQTGISTGVLKLYTAESKGADTANTQFLSSVRSLATTNLGGAFGQWTSSASTLTGGLGTLTATVGAIAGGVIALGLGIGALEKTFETFRIGVDAASQFETSLTKIVNLAGQSKDSIGAMSQEVLDLGPKVGKGPQELADALYFIASNGFHGAEALDILKNAAEASAIGLGKTDEVAHALVGTLKAYEGMGLTAEQATRILIATVQEGNVEANQLAGTLGRVVGQAAELGIAFKDVSAFIATFTRVGIDASEATTALRGIMGVLEGQGKKSKEALASVGLTLADLRAEVKDRGLTAVLIDLYNRFDGNIEKMREFIPNVRALTGFLSTAGAQGKDYAEVQRSITAAMNDSNYVADRMANLQDTLQFQVDQTKAKIQAASISVGEDFIPSLKEAAKQGQPVVDAMLAIEKAVARLVGTKVSIAVEIVTTLVGAVKSVAGPVLGAYNSASDFLDSLEAGIKGQLSDKALEVDATNIDLQSAGNAPNTANLFGNADKFGAQMADTVRKALSGAAEGAKDFTQRLRDAQEAVRNLTAADKAQIDAALKLHESEKTIVEDLNAHVPALHLTVEALKLYEDQQRAAAKAAKVDGSQAIDEFLRGLYKLDAEVQHAIDSGTSWDAIVRSWGPQLLQASQKAGALGVTISDLGDDFVTATQKAAQAHWDAIVAKQAPGVHAEAEKIFKDLAKLSESARKEESDRIVADNKKVLDLASQLEDARAKKTLSATDYQIFQLKRWADAQRASLDTTSKDYQKNLDLIDGIVTEKTAEIVAHATEPWKDAYQVFSDDMAAIADSFAKIGDAADNAFGRAAKSLGGVAAAFGKAAQMQRAGDQGSLGNLINNWDTNSGMQNAAGVATVGVQGVQGGAEIMNATNVQGRGNRALAGAEKGAAVGTMIMPGWGTVIGAAVGAIVGALRNPGFEQEIKRISAEFGSGISETLAKNIDALKDQLFKGDRQAAEIYMQSDILDQAGGLKPSNIDAFTHKLRDTFSMLDEGKFTVQQAQDVLEKNFSKYADYIGKSKDLASKDFQDIIKLNASMGTHAASVQQFVETAAGTLGASITNLAGPLADSVGEFGAKLAAAQAQVDALTADGKQGTEDYTKAVAALNDLQAQQGPLAAANADEIHRLGTIALAAFNAAVAGGADYLTALNSMGPALDQLIAIQKTLGVEGHTAALQELEDFRARANGNQTLVLGAEALGQTLRALTSIGGLSVETLADMESQGLQTFQRLEAAGFSDNEALQLMKDYLTDVMEAHTQLGTPIDENTAKLIDQARQAGILGKDTKSATDIMKEGMDHVVGAVGLLVKALGHDVPAAVQDSINALNNIPRNVDIDVTYNDPGLPSHPNDAQTPDLPNVPGFAAGTDGLKNFGAGTPAVLHGWEAVVTAADYRSMMRSVSRDVMGSRAAMMSTASVAAGGAPARASAPPMQAGDTNTFYVNASAIDTDGLRELVEGEDGIGKLILEAMRTNRRGMQTAARDILGIS